MKKSEVMMFDDAAVSVWANLMTMKEVVKGEQEEHVIDALLSMVNEIKAAFHKKYGAQEA